MMVFEYEVKAREYDKAGDASSDFRGQLKKMSVNPAVIRRVGIAMYEAEINMVIHAEGGHITCTLTDDVIQIELTDNGPGIENIDLAMQAGYSTASDEARNMGFGAGMGLANMKRFIDDFDIESEVGKGTKIKLRIRR